MRLSIVIFDGVTTLDAIGGYEVLSRIPGIEVEFVSFRRGVVAADTRALGLLAYRADSGDRDHRDRSIVISEIGDRDHGAQRRRVRD